MPIFRFLLMSFSMALVYATCSPTITALRFKTLTNAYISGENILCTLFVVGNIRVTLSRGVDSTSLRPHCFIPPPLLFNIEWDPSEAIPLDTSLPEYALEAEYLQKQADIHISSIVAGPSQYLAQNYSRVPCCPRGKSDGLFHFENIDNLTSVSESTTAVGGPWADCICQRITI